MPVYTKKRDLPTYPEPPSGRYGTYLPTYPARLAITTAVTSHVMSLPHFDFQLDSRGPTYCLSRSPQAPEKIGCGPTLRAFFARAVSDSPRSALTHLFPLSLRAFVRRIGRRCVGRTSIRPTGHCSDV